MGRASGMSGPKTGTSTSNTTASGGQKWPGSGYGNEAKTMLTRCMVYYFSVLPIEMVAYVNDSYDYLIVMYIEDGRLVRFTLTRDMFDTIYSDGVGFELNVSFNLRSPL